VSADDLRPSDAPAATGAIELDEPIAQPWWHTWRWPLRALGIVYAWIAGGFASFTWESNVAVFAPGALFLLIAFLRPPPRLPPGRPVTRRAVLVWVVVLGAFTVMELLNLFLGSTHAHPTLSILMAPVLENHFAKFAAVLVWLRVGAELLRR
jgi:hypothetical protein